MYKLREVGNFIVDWKKTFAGTVFTVIAMFIAISTGAIKIWETAEEIIHRGSAKIEQPKIPIHDHVTFEINKLTRKLEREGIIIQRNTKSLNSDTLITYKQMNKSKLMKQIPSKK